MGNYGLLWYRGFALEPRNIICIDLKKSLDYFGATRMVVGHPTQSNGKILERCNHTFYVIDVGIGGAYNGNIAAREIDGDKETAFYPNKRFSI